MKKPKKEEVSELINRCKQHMKSGKSLKENLTNNELLKINEMLQLVSI